MELTLHKPGDHHFIRSFDARGVTVTDTLYRASLVLSADRLVSDWPVRSVADLSDDHLETVLEMESPLSGQDVSFDPPPAAGDEDEVNLTPSSYISAAGNTDPALTLERQQAFIEPASQDHGAVEVEEQVVGHGRLQLLVHHTLGIENAQ